MSGIEKDVDAIMWSDDIINNILPYLQIAAELILGVLIVFNSLYLLNLSKKVSRLGERDRPQPSNSIQPWLDSQSSRLDNLDRTIQTNMLQQRTLRAQTEESFKAVNSNLENLSTVVSKLNGSHVSLIDEFKAMPKPSPYTRFPDEFNEAYEDTKSKMAALKKRVIDINNNYDVKVYEPVMMFIDEEIEDVNKSQAPIENLAGRVTVVDRMLRMVEESLDRPEIIRRMKKLKEDGFSERLEL